MKQVISYFLYNGTMHILLDGDDNRAPDSAFIARFYDQWIKVNVYKSQACVDWPKVIESSGSDKHTRVKFFWRRIRCPCLDKAYEEVKSIKKMGVCFNQRCAHRYREVERTELRCCSRCRSVIYCSRECQVADWSVHKEFCDGAAIRAEFDASKRSNKSNADQSKRILSYNLV
jgi:CDGSH-type Zn-finger protein